MSLRAWERAGLSLAVLAALLSAAVALRVYETIPHVEDDFANLWQAQVMADGRLYVESPPEPRSFIVPFVIDHEGRRFGKYPPGWPATLSLGAAAGLSWLVNPLLSGLAVWLIFRLGRRLLPPPLALLAALLAATSPMLLMLGGSFMSHSLSLVLSAAFALAWLDLFVEQARPERPAPRLLPLMAAAGCAGLLLLTRPLTAAGVLLPFALHGLWLLWRRPASRGRLLAIAVGALLLAALLPLWQYALTGDPTRSPYTLWWPYDRVGFGPGIGVLEGGHTPWQAYFNARFSLRAGQHDLFGWPFLSWIFLPFGWLALRRRAGARLLFLVLPGLIGVYAFYWIGAWLFGPRYYFEALPGVAIASAAGFGWLAGWPGRAAWAKRPRRLGLTALLALLVAGNVLFYWPARLGGLHGLYDIDAAELAPLRAADLDGSLIFVDAEHWTDYASLLPLAPPFSDRDVLVAWSRQPGPNERLLEHFAEYRPLYYEPERPGVLFTVPPPSWER